MDAKSPPVCPDSFLARLLMEAPILPYALAAVLGTWLGLHGRFVPLEPVVPWLLTVPALVLLSRPRLCRFAAWVLVVAAGLAAGIAGRAPDLSVLRLDSPVVVEGHLTSHIRGIQGEEWLWLRAETVETHGRRIEGPFDILVGLPGGQLPIELTQPAWGQSVRLKGFLKRSPALDTGTEPRPAPWRLDLPSWRFWQVTRPAAGWQRAATAARAWADHRLVPGSVQTRDRSMTLGAALRRAVVVGSPDHLPRPLRRALRATGLSHLLAVSGLHVGLVAGWLWLLCMPLGRRTRLLVALLAVAAYLLLVGPKASAVRAAGMGGIVALALCCRRPPQALNAAALWAALLVLWQPQMLDDLGFRLSMAATVGILALGPTLGEVMVRGAARCGLRGGPARLGCQGLAVSLAAQLSTLPLLTPWTALVHPAAPLLNLVAVPWLTVFLGLSLVSLPMPWLDPWLVPALDVLASPLDRLIETPPSPWTTLPVAWSTAECLAVVILIVALLLWPCRVGRTAVLIALLGLQGGGPDPVAADDARPLEFVRLDVGQGDALLLRDGPHVVLVDGGGWRQGDIGARVLVPALARLGIRRLDALVLTHPDTDHCRGLVDLSSYVPVTEVWAAPGWRDDCADQLLARRGPRWRPVWRGDLAAVGRWRVDVLWPPAGLRRGDANDRSLVLRATGGRHRVLLAADIEAATERRLMNFEGERLRATILGVGHHGSKTSTSRTFLAAVAPRLATVGVGVRNAYGHPHPTVLDRLDTAGVRLHRTDLMGSLRLRLDPRELVPQPTMAP